MQCKVSMDERNYQHEEGMKQLRQDAIDKKVLELCECVDAVESAVFEFSRGIAKAYINGAPGIGDIIVAALELEAARLVDEERENDAGDCHD